MSMSHREPQHPIPNQSGDYSYSYNQTDDNGEGDGGDGWGETQSPIDGHIDKI